MKNASLKVVKLLVAAAVVVGSLSGTARAQALKGTFTLPYEVHWGDAVLSAGSYSITMDSVRGPALVTPTVGRGPGLVIFGSLDSASPGRPTGLLVTRIEDARIVRSFNWREGGKNFVYKPFTKAEHEIFAKASGSEAVPVAMAKK
jgi:hypothetical protein